VPASDPWDPRVSPLPTPRWMRCSSSRATAKDRVDETHQLLAETVSTGSAAKESVRHRKDGSLVYVDVTTKLVRGADDASELIVISHRDVTATHNLHEDAPIQAPFGGLLESAPDAIVIVNALGRIVLLHVQTDQLVGHRSNDLVGKSVGLVAGAVPGRARLLSHGLLWRAEEPI